jgi:hypothetical protein
MYNYNFAFYPSAFFGGGYRVYTDAPDSAQEYADLITECGAREVPPMGLITTMWAAEDNTYEIRVRITNGMPANVAPTVPPAPIGESQGLVDVVYEFRASTTDGDNDQLLYQWDWGDGNVSGWIGPVGSGENCLASHGWTAYDTCEIKVRVKDSWETVSGWSPPLSVMIGPECCQVRGDVDDSGGEADISDLVYLVDFMFTGGPEAPCLKQADIDASGGIDISDLVYLVDFMFTGGPVPPGC